MFEKHIPPPPLGVDEDWDACEDRGMIHRGMSYESRVGDTGSSCWRTSHATRQLAWLCLFYSE